MAEGWTIPGFPQGCMYTGKIVIRRGCVPSCVVLKKVDGDMPYATYTAICKDGKWSFIDGHYFDEQYFEEAKTDFGERDRLL